MTKIEFEMREDALTEISKLKIQMQADGLKDVTVDSIINDFLAEIFDLKYSRGHECSDSYGRWCNDCFNSHRINEYCPKNTLSTGDIQD